MKKALVLSLAVVLGLGFASFAQALSGSWNTSIAITTNPVVITNLDSVLKVDYTVSGWDFGITADFTSTSFNNLFFTAGGNLGAFSLKSALDFVPVTAQFKSWLNVGRVSLAGVDAFAAFEVYNFGTNPAVLIGTGALLGVQATMGDVKVTAISFFNMANTTYYWWAYGIDYALTKMASQSSCSGAWSNPSSSFFAVQTAGCTLAWSGATIWVDVPFACVDASLYLTMNCTTGFSGMGVWLTNLESGLSWLNFSEIDIDFTLTSKSVSTYFGLNLGDTACIKPYWSIDLGGGNHFTLDSLTLNALVLSYKFGAVTFKAGEIFDFTWASVSNGSVYTYGFSKTGDITSTCIYNGAYDEFFGIFVDGDACCGGAFKASVVSFFNTALQGTSIFDWAEILAQVNIGVGSNTKFGVGGSFTNTGLNTLFFSVGFSW